VPGFSVTGWGGILAPAVTPAPILAQVQRDVARALSTHDVQERLAADGIEPVASTPQQFDAYIRQETARWAQVVKTAGIRSD
jgi:tripartite-type tricarboxylate transporter receptor subunit TctC